MPWYTYPAYEFIEQLDVSNCDVFEWGSGNSTKYWARRANHVVSVDNKVEWTEEMKGIRNVSPLLASDEKYPKMITGQPLFDIVVIDGVQRLACAKKAVGNLKKTGMIILDNSDWYFGALQHLSSNKNLLRVDFSGFGPINNYSWSTSVFMSRDFQIPFKSDKRINPVGGLLKDLDNDS